MVSKKADGEKEKSGGLGRIYKRLTTSGSSLPGDVVRSLAVCSVPVDSIATGHSDKVCVFWDARHLANDVHHRRKERLEGRR